MGLLLYSCVQLTYIFFGSVAPQHDEASNAWKRLAHIPILFTILWREPTGTNRRKNGSKHRIGSAIGEVLLSGAASIPSPWGSGLLLSPNRCCLLRTTPCMSTLDLTRAVCLQERELAMWSAYWCYIVGIVDVGRFGCCARCRALGLLVSLACFVGGTYLPVLIEHELGRK